MAVAEAESPPSAGEAAIAKAAMLSYATPSISFMSPGARGYLDLAERYPYNPERAKALLTASSQTAPAHDPVGSGDTPPDMAGRRPELQPLPTSGDSDSGHA